MTTFTMVDNINPDMDGLSPADFDATAGYVPGSGWPDDAAEIADFPSKPNLSITTNPADNAECLDIENGAATAANAPSWCARQIARGLAKPWLYTSASNALAVVNAMGAAGYSRDRYYLWIAHYTYEAHICLDGCGGYDIPGGADGTQWTDKDDGNDESEISATFYAALGGTVTATSSTPSTPTLPTSPVEDDDMEYQFTITETGQGCVGNGQTWRWITSPTDLATVTARITAAGGTVANKQLGQSTPQASVPNVWGMQVFPAAPVEVTVDPANTPANVLTALTDLSQVVALGSDVTDAQTAITTAVQTASVTTTAVIWAAQAGILTTTPSVWGTAKWNVDDWVGAAA